MLIAYIRDPSWYHVSLLAPPQIVVWSSPCVSWSKGGLARGLLSQDGLLFLDAASLVQVFGPPVDVGENVTGLLDHPDGKTIRSYLSFIGSEHFQVHLSQLSTMMPMSRGRTFLSRGLPKRDNGICQFSRCLIHRMRGSWMILKPRNSVSLLRMRRRC